MSNRIGTIFATRYRIAALLARTGMSELYRARDLHLERVVAVKILSTQGDSPLAARFQQEARIVAALDHRNILPVLDFGVEDDLLYMIMPFANGGTLRDRIHGRLMSPADVTAILQPLSEALAYAHGRQPAIIHRDLKPSNILFMKEDERPLLADFGIAKILGGDTTIVRANGQPGLTRTGAVIGTPEYMSPEQAEGAIVDARSDVYSLGIILYEMLGGAVPFHGANTWETLGQHIREPLPPLRKRNPGVSKQLEAVIGKALAKQPDDRFVDTGELWQAWQAALEGRFAIPSTPKHTPVPAAHASRGIASGWKWLLVGAGALLLVLAVGYMLYRSPVPGPQAETAYQQGKVYLASGLPQLAIIEFDKALAADGSYKDAALLRGQASNELIFKGEIDKANQLLADSKFCEAGDLYDKLMNRPNSAQETRAAADVSQANVFNAYLGCSRSQLLANNDVRAAMDRLSSALSLPGREQDKDALALQNLLERYQRGLRAYQASAWDQAISEFTPLADSIPKSKEYLAQSYLNRGRQTKAGGGPRDLEKALTDYNKAETYQPDSTEITNEILAARSALYQLYTTKSAAMLSARTCDGLALVEEYLNKAAALDPAGKELPSLNAQLEALKKITLEGITNSRQSFSGVQGRGGWYYLIIGENGTLQPLNFWDEAAQQWYTFHQWVRMDAIGAHPGNPQASNSDDIVRRWSSYVTGRLHIYATAYKLDVSDPYNPGNGVMVYLRHNGERVWARRIDPLDSIGIHGAEITVLDVGAGDNLDFGMNGLNDPGHDYTAFEITISREKRGCE